MAHQKNNIFVFTSYQCAQFDSFESVFIDPGKNSYDYSVQ